MEQEVKKYGWRDEVDARWKNFKWKAEETSQKVKKAAVKWCAENPEAVTTIVVGTAVGCIKIGKNMARNQAVKREQDWKDTHIYDHSIGRYVELRRKLKSSEYAKVLERKERSGKSISVVLAEMGLLK